MWAILQDQASSSFVSLQDGSTLGSARSNRIVLPQKSVRALQGQFKLHSTGWVYRDFVTNAVHEIKSGARLSFGEFSVSLVNEETHARDFLLSVASVWRQILNKEPQLSFDLATLVNVAEPAGPKTLRMEFYLELPQTSWAMTNDKGNFVTSCHSTGPVTFACYPLPMLRNSCWRRHCRMGQLN